MTRKRWILIGGALLVACLLVAIVGAVFLVKTVPGVARLVLGDPPTPTPRPTLRATFTPALPLATLTPTPRPPKATDTPPPSPSAPPMTAPPTATEAQPSREPTGTPTGTLSPTPEPATSTPPLPTPASRPQWIAFETIRGKLGDYEIFVMAPDGSRLTNVTNSWADDVAPVWSPDGKRIAFVSLRDTLTGKWSLEKGSIYIMGFDPWTGVSTGEVVRLTDDGGADGWPTWSPDGRRIAFHSKRSGDWDIWVINTDGTGLINLTNHPADDRSPAWSPDGARIAFTSKRSGNDDIWVMEVEKALQGDNESHLVNLTNRPGRDRYPLWSPDGQQLTFNTKRDGDFEIYVMQADGSNPRNISQSPSSTEGLADWSPDGQRLVFYSDRFGNKDVFIIKLTGGKWINLTNHPASDEFCSWSP